ncbi:MAG: hypothetical protein ACYS99_13585 [Planctomycetota bacterium]|jgi:hypothetical protein
MIFRQFHVPGLSHHSYVVGEVQQRLNSDYEIQDFHLCRRNL